MNSVTHPFLLADNRHYAFYIWRRILNPHPLARYLLTPLYLIAGKHIYGSLCTFHCPSELSLMLIVCRAHRPSKEDEIIYVPPLFLLDSSRPCSDTSHRASLLPTTLHYPSSTSLSNVLSLFLISFKVHFKTSQVVTRSCVLRDSEYSEHLGLPEQEFRVEVRGGQGWERGRRERRERIGKETKIHVVKL